LGTQTPAMNLHLHERKFELDSILAFLKLSTKYYQYTRDIAAFDDLYWQQAVASVLNIIEAQQADTDQGSAYFFQRNANEPTDTLLHGVGAPARKTGAFTVCLISILFLLTPKKGMAKSPFRPSDDASTYLFPVKFPNL